VHHQPVLEEQLVP